MESNEVLTMRLMAWQRVKGELQAMLATFWPGPADADRQDPIRVARDDLREKILYFVEDVEQIL